MSISGIIQQAVFSLDAESRSKAEKSLFELLNNDSKIFFQTIVEELVKESNESNLRQASAAILKRCILHVSGETVSWLKLDSEIKKSIKISLLGNLITKDAMALRSTADVISVIASIEIPRNEWQELIPLLIQNINYTALEIKKAAIITLGFICEALKNANNSNCIDNHSKEMIMMGILLCLNPTQTNKDIKHTSIKALHDSLSMMEPVFENKQHFNYFVGLLLENCKHEDSQIKISTLQCLIDFCKLNILKLNEYSEIMLQIISPLMTEINEDIVILAIELWITIAEEEKNNFSLSKQSNFSFMEKIFDKLLALLLQNLTKSFEGEDENDDDDQNGIKEISFRAICSIVELLGDKCLEIIATFVSNLINSDNNSHKKASLLAFASLMDGPSDQKISPLISEAFIPILALLFHQDLSLRKVAAFTISRISEFHALDILQHPKFPEILPKILEVLNDKPVVSKKICFILGYLSESSLKTKETNLFHSYIENIINLLLKNSVREDISTKDSNLINITFASVMHIIHNCKNENVIAKYLHIFIEQTKIIESVAKEKKESFMSGILSTIQICILELKEKVSQELADEIYKIIIMNFQKEKKVNSEGIYVVSALANGLAQKFSKYLQDYAPYLDYALNSVQEPELLKAAIGNISDFCKACEINFEPFLNAIVPALLASLNNVNFDKNLKLSIILCLGDIAIGCSKSLLQYIDSILILYDSFFKAAASLTINAHSDMLDYLEELKDNLIESFTCFVHAFAQSEKSQNLFNHFPHLIEFIQFTCDKKYNPTINYIRNCLNLLADVGFYYKGKVESLIKTPTTENLINILRKYADCQENKYTLNYITHIIKVVDQAAKLG